MLLTRTATLLGLVLLLAPVAASAQADDDPASDAADMTLVGQLCAAAAADEAEQAACISAVTRTLADMASDPFEDPDSPAEVRSLLDETQARIDDVARGAQEFELDLDIDLQAAIDDAVAALERLDLSADIDLQAAIDHAMAAALAAGEDIDLGALLDEALAGALSGIEDAGVQAAVDSTLAALQQNVEDARAVVSEAQQWAQQNTETVCRGGSVSLGTTVGVVVFALTGVEWLGLQAFRATERFSNGVCGEIVE